jgi:hypothetical protein
MSLQEDYDRQHIDAVDFNMVITERIYRKGNQ